ncbi:MAG: alkaline phosphatase [Phycisphaerae bacterium]|jgi:alkaline phosphatase
MRGSLGKVALIILCLIGTDTAVAESPRQWYRDGRTAVQYAKRLTPITTNAKNVILFVADGMNIPTVTAARILAGQQKGKSGEENLLSFERLPYSAFVKTYNVDYQTPDSAGTITAMITGVKSNLGVLSVNQRVKRGHHETVDGNRLTTLFELAEQTGLSTGVVSTTRVTHATPAGCYAHSPERDWESSGDLPEPAKKAGFPDIARQLIEFHDGDGLDVVLGGGRRNFLPDNVQDPEYPGSTGRRDDGRNLTTEWTQKPDAVYVWNKTQLAGVDFGKTERILGLFQPSHMNFENDRPKDKAGEPSLTEMTVAAIELLAKNNKGYVLLVEGGRIDHAHHANNAYRALTDTIEFASAVRAALERTSRFETLVIVTADHGHMFEIGGDARRGNPILGKVTTPESDGTSATPLAHDAVGLPHTTLFYTMGPGYPGPSAEQPEGPKRFRHHGTAYRYASTGRPDLTDVDTADPDYLTEAGIPARSAPHSSADVPLYADGPHAHLLRGVIEQNVIFHVMVEALGLADRAEGPNE